MLFLIPTVEDTLRVNGNAAIVNDHDLLAKLAHRGNIPQLAIAVEVEEVFFHCAKAFKRSGLWNPAGWSDQSDRPSLGRILLDQTKVGNLTEEELSCTIEEAYRTKLY